MGKTKLIACRFDMPLYNKINEHVIQNSDLIRQAVTRFLNDGTQENIEVDEDDLYNTVYNDLYNMEIVPLKQDNEHLNQSVHDLEGDKHFLMDEVRALTIMNAGNRNIPVYSKIPLLQKINLFIKKWKTGEGD